MKFPMNAYVFMPFTVALVTLHARFITLDRLCGAPTTRLAAKGQLSPGCHHH